MRESLAVKRSPGTRLNVASCARDEGDLLAALAGFEAARDEARSYPDPERGRLWADAADQALQQLLPRLAEIRLVQPSGEPLPDSWNVRMDDEPLLLDRGRARQNPGPHRLVIDAAGYRPYLVDLRLAEGERSTLRVVLEPAVAPAPMGPPVRARVTRSLPAEPGTSLLPTVLVIGGGVLTLTGLTFGVVTWQRKNDLEASCPGLDCSDGELDDAERLATVADVLVVSGVALGVAGGAWLLWGSSSEPSARLQAGCSGSASCRASLRMTF